MSCLIDKFSYFKPLTKHERDLLDALEKEEEAFRKGDIVFKQNDSNQLLYVVKHGWFANYSYLPDGGRIILNFHFPGDIIGTNSLPFERNISGLLALSEGVLCPFTQDGLRDIFIKEPELTALIFSIGMQDNVELIDRLKAVGRMEKEGKIALFLLQIRARLFMINHCNQEDNRFDFPLSQEIIGDALGLTTVYVNRMMKSLEARSLIEREGRKIRLLDPDGLAALCDFNEEYYRIRTEWYPKHQCKAS